ncbi:MAG TPA: NADH-quinone oxidoreductase subunit M [Dehalococcoidia bacterium]
MLSAIIFLPALGALVTALLPASRAREARVVALAFSLATFALTAWLFATFDRGETGFQFVQTADWIRVEIGGFNTQYAVGVDGISVALVLLTAFLTLVAVLVSWNIALRPKEYFAWLLFLETGVLGVFTALDFVLFFLFWEVELLPMYLLISIWGSGRKQYSAMKFLLYTIAGSAFLLVGMLITGFAAGTFNLVELNQAEITDAAIPLWALFVLLMAAFVVKLPVVPFHTWLPDAHTDAPTAVSVILAGVLLKMGGYGIIRIAVGILPEQARDFAPYLVALAAVNVVYGALIVLRQTDLKRLVAYSSVSHMGYVLLGIFALGEVGLTGATLQMFTHGTITGLLFVMVGLIYDRTHTREISEMSGLAHRVPVIATVMVIAGLASLGLPAMSGFVAELLVFLGAFEEYTAATVAAVLGVVLAAGYILWMIQRVFFGPRNERWDHLEDATAWWEQLPMGALVAVILAVGVYPAVLVDVISTGVQPLLERLG